MGIADDLSERSRLWSLAPLTFAVGSRNRPIAADETSRPDCHYSVTLT